MNEHLTDPESEGPAGGWGSLKSIARIYAESLSNPAVLETLKRHNKPGGFMCVSCAWPKPANYHPFEFCENGAKATHWESTSARCGPDFWKDHTSHLGMAAQKQKNCGECPRTASGRQNFSG